MRDELNFLPIDSAGADLLPQAILQACRQGYAALVERYDQQMMAKRSWRLCTPKPGQ